jgi:protein CpxP
MKKLALVLAIGIFTFGSVSAQTIQNTKIKNEKKNGKETVKTGGTEKKHDGKHDERRTPEQRADMQAQKLAKKFNLTADQTAKIRQISLDKANRMEALKAKNKDSRQANGAEMKEIKSSWEGQLQSVLTQDQYAQYVKERDDKMAERKEKRGDMKKGGYKNNN